MKKKFNSLVFACLVMGILNSCGDETPETESATLDQELTSGFKGKLTFDNKTYVFNFEGVTSKFTNEKLNYRYDIVSKIDFTPHDFNLKGQEDVVRIDNPNTGEYIIFENIEEINSTNVKFDIKTSNGLTIENINFDYTGYVSGKNDQSKVACPYCWPIAWVVAEIVEAISDASSDNYDSNCHAAINSCGSSGVASVEIIDGGWFSQDSCKVTCK